MFVNLYRTPATPEPAPPRLWKQGLAALLGLVFVITGVCFEFWYSPAAALVAMGTCFFLANFLIALPKPRPLSDKMTFLAAMHGVQFCLLLTCSVNGLLPLTLVTFACSLVGMAWGTRLQKTSLRRLGSRAAG